MSLREKENITKIYRKNTKKSIRRLNRIDVFLLLAIMVMLITPIVTSLLAKGEIRARQVNLYLSPQFSDFFGKELTEELLKEFENNNPDIRIKIAENPEDPNILIFDEGSFNALAAAETLVELNSYTNFDSGTRQLAIPLVSFMNLLFYNIDILTAAGFDSPPKTRDEFTSYVRGVSRGDLDASGAAISLDLNDRQALSRDIFSWIWASGGNFLPDGEKPVVNTRVIINDLTFLGTLNRERFFAPEILNTSGDQRLEEFAQGRVAMMISSTQVIPYLRERMGDSAFGITTIPGTGAGGRYSIGLSEIYTAISVNSLNPDEAWRFLEFLAGKSSVLCNELNAVPGSVSNFIPGDYVIDDPFYSKAWEIFEASQIAESFSGTHKGELYETAFLEEIRIFFEANRTAQQTVNIIQQRWDEIYSSE